MNDLRLTIARPDGTVDPDVAEELRRDLDENVAPASFAETDADAGAKGMAAMQIATIAISLLGTPAIVALVRVLKSYVERDRTAIIILDGPRGRVELKLPGGANADDIRRAIDGVLAPA